jgi:hypothetical protein
MKLIETIGGKLSKSNPSRPVCRCLKNSLLFQCFSGLNFNLDGDDRFVCGITLPLRLGAGLDRRNRSGAHTRARGRVAPSGRCADALLERSLAKVDVERKR